MTTREDVVGSLMLAVDLLTRDDELGEEDVEQAMLEVALALVRMRKLPGGVASRARLKDRAKAELARRKVACSHQNKWMPGRNECGACADSRGMMDLRKGDAR